MTGLEPVRWSRRSVLAGLGALSLAACAKDGGSSTASDAEPVPQGDGAGFALLSFFPANGVIVAGRSQRLPFGLGDERGAALEAVPERLAMSVTEQEGRQVAPTQDVAAHADGLERAYFPLSVDLPDPGVYRVRSEVDGQVVEAAFEAGASSPVPQVGDPMPVVATPTMADPAGVDPICTRQPACPLHQVSLADAVGSGKPTVLLISTPAFCQVAICGPVLDVLLSQIDDRATFIHAEVYASGQEARENIVTARLAPVMDAFGLSFEPCLVIADGSGVIRHRFDAIYDRGELADALASL